jgi:hypothetical protein
MSSIFAYTNSEVAIEFALERLAAALSKPR